MLLSRKREDLLLFANINKIGLNLLQMTSLVCKAFHYIQQESCWSNIYSTNIKKSSDYIKLDDGQYQDYQLEDWPVDITVQTFDLIDQLLKSQVKTPSWSLHSYFQVNTSIQISSQSQNFNSHLQVKTSNQNFKSKRQVKTSNQNGKSKRQIKTPSQNVKSKRQVKTSYQNFKSKRQVKTSNQNATSKCQIKTPSQNVISKSQVKTQNQNANSNLQAKWSIQNYKSKCKVKTSNYH